MRRREKRGKNREKRDKKWREPRGVKKETLRVIIRSNIILRLEVS